MRTWCFYPSRMASAEQWETSAVPGRGPPAASPCRAPGHAAAPFLPAPRTWHPVGDDIDCRNGGGMASGRRTRVSKFPHVARGEDCCPSVAVAWAPA